MNSILCAAGACYTSHGSADNIVIILFPLKGPVPLSSAHDFRALSLCWHQRFPVSFVILIIISIRAAFDVYVAAWLRRRAIVFLHSQSEQAQGIKIYLVCSKMTKDHLKRIWNGNLMVSYFNLSTSVSFELILSLLWWQVQERIRHFPQ